jgi:hypothetical protein
LRSKSSAPSYAHQKVALPDLEDVVDQSLRAIGVEPRMGVRLPAVDVKVDSVALSNPPVETMDDLLDSVALVAGIAG